MISRLGPAIRRRLTYANVMATGAMFAVLGGGAYAAISSIPDSSGVFHGCVNKRTAVLRIVQSANSCRSARTRHGRTVDPGEFAIAWNQRGADGQPGTPGAQGAPGAQGTPGAPGSPASLPASEGWHFVGASGQPGFENGWANNGASKVGFYKDPLGIVHLRGSAVGNGGGTQIFTLPTRYAPDHAPFVEAASGCTTAAISVGDVGDVYSGGASGVCNLDGITFRAG